MRSTFLLPRSSSSGGRSTGLPRNQERGTWNGLDLAALAAAGAFCLVAFDAVAVPLIPSRSAVGLDAVANEWIVWFTVLYLALTGAVALVDKAASLRTSRWGQPAPNVPNAPNPSSPSDAQRSPGGR